MEKIGILNISVLSVRKHELLKNLDKGILFTPNVDHLVRLQKDREFNNAYQQAEWVICDSVILQRFSKLLKHGIVESIPGSSLFHDYCFFHRNNENCRIFILGGGDGVSRKAQNNINQRIGRDIVVGTHSPSFQFVSDEKENIKILQIIESSKANVLVVCATSPKQEIWIAKYWHQLPNVRLFMALGATVDFEAEKFKRCPLWIQHLGMEWFWRFCQEPTRLFHRYFIRDMQFFWYFGKQLLGVYKSPFC